MNFYSVLSIEGCLDTQLLMTTGDAPSHSQLCSLKNGGGLLELTNIYLSLGCGFEFWSQASPMDANSVHIITFLNYKIRLVK
jgi:hypothetical protein